MARKSNFIFPKEAQKDLDRLPPQVLKRILNAFGRLEKNPHLAKRLSGPFRQVRSYRFGTPGGEFRITFISRPEGYVVLVIGPRKDVYKTLKRRLS